MFPNWVQDVILSSFSFSFYTQQGDKISEVLYTKFLSVYPRRESFQVTLTFSVYNYELSVEVIIIIIITLADLSLFTLSTRSTQDSTFSKEVHPSQFLVRTLNDIQIIFLRVIFMKPPF